MERRDSAHMMIADRHEPGEGQQIIVPTIVGHGDGYERYGRPAAKYRDGAGTSKDQDSLADADHGMLHPSMDDDILAQG